MKDCKSWRWYYNDKGWWYELLISFYLLWWKHKNNHSIVKIVYNAYYESIGMGALLSEPNRRSDCTLPEWTVWFTQNIETHTKPGSTCVNRHSLKKQSVSCFFLLLLFLETWLFLFKSSFVLHFSLLKFWTLTSFVSLFLL